MVGYISISFNFFFPFNYFLVLQVMISSRVSCRILHFFQNLVLKDVSFSKLGIASLILK